MTKHSQPNMADAYSMALAKRDRANNAIARLTREIAEAKRRSQHAHAARLGFQKAFVYNPMRQEAMREIELTRPRLVA